MNIGTRLRLTRNVERFPHFIAPKGATGTVTDVTDGNISVLMDDHLAGAEEWDNEIVWSADFDDGDPLLDAEVIEQLCEWFALCDNIATATEPHPVIGSVPICDRCAAKLEAM